LAAAFGEHRRAPGAQRRARNHEPQPRATRRAPQRSKCRNRVPRAAAVEVPNPRAARRAAPQR